MNKVLVFTDLDGSLLDHHNYGWSQALPALDILRTRNIPVIINSSKTGVEIHELKCQMDNQDPFIAENGAIAYLPGTLNSRANSLSDYHAHYFASSYQQIIKALEQIRKQHAFKYRGFNDMAVEEVAQLCDLDTQSAQHAKSREASEPLLWLDTDEALSKFEFLLKDQGLTLTKGGRFYHVMSRVNKGDTLKWMIKQFQEMAADTHYISIGLGDSYNDVAMLETVDYPVLIKNNATKQPQLTGLRNLIYTKAEGPAGWNEAVTQLVNEIL